jgi:hypothetical protein
MRDAPCGCDLRETAMRTPDPRAREVLLADAARCSAAWGCGGEKRQLTDVQRAALDTVARVVGCDAEEITECPGRLVRREEAHVVARALVWWQKGQLHLRHAHPHGALVEAIDIANASVRAREHDDIERARQRAKERDRG